MAWQEVGKGRGKGGSGVEASLAAMQTSITQLAAVGRSLPPQGKGGPRQGTCFEKGAKRKGQVPGAQGAQSETPFRECYCHDHRGQMP